MASERNYQNRLIKKLKKTYPDAIIMKADANYIQGIPDILVLNNDKWASLEVKRSKAATHRPNQDEWVERMNNMSFSRFIYPENEQEVLHDLEQAFHKD